MVMTRPPQFIAALLSGRSPGLRASCEHVCAATFPCSEHSGKKQRTSLTVAGAAPELKKFSPVSRFILGF